MMNLPSAVSTMKQKKMFPNTINIQHFFLVLNSFSGTILQLALFLNGGRGNKRAQREWNFHCFSVWTFQNQVVSSQSLNLPLSSGWWVPIPCDLWVEKLISSPKTLFGREKPKFRLLLRTCNVDHSSSVKQLSSGLSFTAVTTSRARATHNKVSKCYCFFFAFNSYLPSALTQGPSSSFPEGWCHWGSGLWWCQCHWIHGWLCSSEKRGTGRHCHKCWS